MRIDLSHAGLMTMMMAGRGFLPADDTPPDRAPVEETWASYILPPVPGQGSVTRKPEGEGGR
ncbi:hypothetical protein [Acidocella sp.]|uniref:hypothetical protein n=1 Tax=Acidocella sp. TaxID=50710 RepID=UPI0026138CB6|nr:hypothetical protein [Acidocella sp.]